MIKLVADEAPVRYRIRYYQPLDGCWQRMQVRANFSPLLNDLEPEEASELLEALKAAVETTMLCFNHGIGHSKPRTRSWFDQDEYLDSRLIIDLDWQPGALPTSDRTDHTELVYESVCRTITEFIPGQPRARAV